MSGGKPGPKLLCTPEVMARLIELRTAGHSWQDCGEIIGLKWRTLRDKLYRSGVRMGGKRGRAPIITPEVKAQAKTLRDSGMSWADCGEALSVNPKTLKTVMLRSGIPLSPVPAGKPSVATPELKARARELRAQGVCWKLVERALGVSWRALSSAIHLENKMAKQQH